MRAAEGGGHRVLWVIRQTLQDTGMNAMPRLNARVSAGVWCKRCDDGAHDQSERKKKHTFMQDRRACHPQQLLLAPSIDGQGGRQR